MSANERDLRKAPVAKAVAVALTLGVAAGTASANPFQLSSLDGGYMQVAMEGSCGGDKGAKEGSCGGDKGAKGAKEGSCGDDKGAKEGSCGGDKGAKEGSCGGDKGAKEGSCGEAKCGGAA